MASVISEKVNFNNRRIWGSFKLSDGSTTKFEMKKGEGWFQWGNSTDNLWLTVEKVESLCNNRLESLKPLNLFI